jgi:hypothetical protein
MADCLDRLRELAATGKGDPRDAAGPIVREFKSSARRAEFDALKHRLEDTLLAGRHADVPAPYLDQHNRWLAVLESAVAATRSTRAGLGAN